MSGWLTDLSVAIAVVALLGGTAALAAGEVRLGTTTALLGLGFGVGARAGVRSRRWPGHRVPTVGLVQSAGLRFRYSRAAWRTFVGVIVGGAIFAPVLSLQVYTSDDLSARTQTMKFIAPGLVAYAALQLWNVTSGRIRRGEVVVTPEGVTHQTWTGRFHLLWDDVECAMVEEFSATRQGPGIRLRARPERSATHRQTAVALGSPAAHELPDLAIRADQIEGDAALLAHMLVFYAQHPELRDELEDDRALRRALEGRAVVPELSAGEHDEPRG